MQGAEFQSRLAESLSKASSRKSLVTKSPALSPTSSPSTTALKSTTSSTSLRGSTSISRSGTYGINPKQIEALKAQLRKTKGSNEKDGAKNEVNTLLDAPEKKGYLFYGGQTGKDWTRYWCTLKEGALYLFASEQATLPDESVTLCGITVRDKPEHKLCFEITNRSNENWLFKAGVEEEFEFFTWIVSLRGASLYWRMVEPLAKTNVIYADKSQRSPAPQERRSVANVFGNSTNSLSSSTSSLPPLSPAVTPISPTTSTQSPTVSRFANPSPRNLSALDSSTDSIPVVLSPTSSANNTPAVSPTLQPRAPSTSSSPPGSRRASHSDQRTTLEAEASRVVRAPSYQKPAVEELKPKKGWLSVPAGKIITSWKDRWVVLSGPLLTVYKGIEENKELFSTEVMFANAKVVKSANNKYIFEVLITSKTHQFGCASGMEMLDWINSIQEAQMLLMGDYLQYDHVPKSGGKTHSKEDPDAPLQRELDASREALSHVLNTEGNNVCVDCGAADPLWASINLGVFLCINCSGAHRQLGVHISKVRSITMDKWDPQIISFMASVGNVKSNAEFECFIPPTSRKPCHDDPLDVREKFIREKYESKLFAKPPPPPPDS